MHVSRWGLADEAPSTDAGASIAVLGGLGFKAMKDARKTIIGWLDADQRGVDGPRPGTPETFQRQDEPPPITEVRGDDGINDPETRQRADEPEYAFGYFD